LSPICAGGAGAKAAASSLGGLAETVGDTANERGQWLDRTVAGAAPATLLITAVIMREAAPSLGVLSGCPKACWG
jgi:hypothetical protein